MRRSLQFAVVIGCALCFASVSYPGEKELKRLEGVWTLEQRAFDVKTTLEITGNKWVRTALGVPSKGEITLGEKNGVKTIDLKYKRDLKEKVLPGIYKIEKDRLTILWGIPGFRPPRFPEEYGPDTKRPEVYRKVR